MSCSSFIKRLRFIKENNYHVLISALVHRVDHIRWLVKFEFPYVKSKKKYIGLEKNPFFQHLLSSNLALLEPPQANIFSLMCHFEYGNIASENPWNS